MNLPSNNMFLLKLSVPLSCIVSQFGVNHLLQAKTSGTTQELGQPTTNSSILGDDIQILPHVWWRIHPYFFVKPKYCLLKTDFFVGQHLHHPFIWACICVTYTWCLHCSFYIMCTLYIYIYATLLHIHIYIYTYTYKYVYMYVLCNIHHFARWLQFSGERLASSSSLSSFRALWASKSPRAAAKRLLQKLRGFLSSGSENEVYIPLAMSIRDMMINPENLGVPSFSQKGLL